MRDFAFRDIPSLRARAMQYLAADPAEREIRRPRRAATVMLLRDHATSAVRGPEVYVMRRVAAMAFAPGSVVFPGGAVDDGDDWPDTHQVWAGPSPHTWGARLGCSPRDAQMIVVAAVREVFEECGVLLAGPDDRTPLMGLDLSDERWAAARLALLDRTSTLGDVLRDQGLVMRTDALAALGRWVTPEFESRRYDTVFFAARMPQGQQAHHVSTEADHADWADPREVLSEHAAGRVVLLPPTVVWLETLAGLTSLRDLAALEAAADLRPIQPHVHRRGDGRLVIRV